MKLDLLMTKLQWLYRYFKGGCLRGVIVKNVYHLTWVGVYNMLRRTEGPVKCLRRPLYAGETLSLSPQNSCIRPGSKGTRSASALRGPRVAARKKTNGAWVTMGGSISRLQVGPNQPMSAKGKTNVT